MNEILRKKTDEQNHHSQVTHNYLCRNLVLLVEKINLLNIFVGKALKKKMKMMMMMMREES
jgi:hypothetical protein